MFTVKELCMLREAVQTHVETMADVRDGAGAKPPWHTDPDEAKRLAEFVVLDQKIAHETATHDEDMGMRLLRMKIAYEDEYVKNLRGENGMSDESDEMF